MILAFRRRATMQSSCACFAISISISISISSSKAIRESRTTELLLSWQQPPGRVSERLQVASAPGGKCNKIKTANSTSSQGKRCFHIKRQPYNNILRECLSEFLSVFLSPPIYAQGNWNTANVPNCPIWVTRTTKSLTLDAKQPTLTALWQKGSSGYGILTVNSQLQGKKKGNECVTNAAVLPARQNHPLAVRRLSVVTFPAGISKYRVIVLPQSTSPNVSGQPGQLG